jgi:hypothetical protein
MQTPIRYTVVNHGGQPVIRAVPVPRRSVRPAGHVAERRQQERQTDQERHPLLQRIRRLGFRA